jgi:ComF family protein
MNARLSSLLALLYPPSCVACEEVLVTGEEYLCTRCRRDFPRDHASHAELELTFAGACRVGAFHSLFRYRRESRYKNLVYDVKYRGNARLGVFLGRMLGETLAGKTDAAIILPVPLHPRRRRERGFNQSACIARGIASVLQLPVREDLLRRVLDNPSQTGLAPGERATNVENIFAVVAPGELAGKHVLLVDDVVTTGATVSSCLRELAAVPGIRVSVACLARVALA